MSINGLTASGWDTVQPCMSDSSYSCSTWCPNPGGNDNEIEISLDFIKVQFVTGFTVYNLNESYSLNYQINATGSQVNYTNVVGDMFEMGVTVSVHLNCFNERRC